MQIVCYLHNVLCQEYANEAYNLWVPASVSECSHNLQREHFFVIVFFLSSSLYSFLNWHGRRARTIPFENNCKLWLYAVNEWENLAAAGDARGVSGSRHGETGTINRLFKRAPAEGSFLKQQQIEYISAKQREMQMSTSFKPHLGGSYTFPVVPPRLGAALPTWLSVCPSEELPALLLPPQECEESFVMLAA